MTDTERERIKAICEIAGISDIEDLSDGFHSFRQLYYQRMMLFAALVKQNKDKAWKSLRHENGELCFGGGWFVVGIDTSEGSYTYHYEDNFYSFFDCEELECAKHWDGHTEKDVTRLLSLPSAQSEDYMELKLDFLRMASYIDVLLDYIRRVNSELDNLRSAQPEIIRCMDCENWIQGYITDNDDFIPPKCGKYQQMVGHSLSDYCSLAERRTDE